MRKPLHIVVATAITLAAVLLTDIASASPDPPGEPKKDSKISSAIRDVLQKMEDKGVTRANAAAIGASSLSFDNVLRVDERGWVQTYIFVEAAAQDHVADLEAHEADIEVINHDFNIIQEWVPFDRIEAIAAREYVRRVRSPDYAYVRAGSVNTEGDQILNADLVRSQLGFIGSGIRVRCHIRRRRLAGLGPIQWGPAGWDRGRPHAVRVRRRGHRDAGDRPRSGARRSARLLRPFDKPGDDRECEFPREYSLRRFWSGHRRG